MSVRTNFLPAQMMCITEYITGRRIESMRKRKRKQRIICGFLACVLFLGSCPGMITRAQAPGQQAEAGVDTQQSGETEEFYYRCTEGKACIVGVKKEILHLTVPLEINGYPVKIISFDDTALNKKIQSISIPNGMELEFLFADECSALSKFLVARDHPHYTTKSGVLYTKDGNIYWKYF